MSKLSLGVEKVAARPSAVALVDQAERRLAVATTVPEHRALEEIAEAAKRYARTHQEKVAAHVLKWRIARRGGKLLIQMAESGNRAARGKPARAADLPTIASMGLSEGRSQRWQTIAKLDEARFQAAIATLQNSDEDTDLSWAVREVTRKQNRKLVDETSPPTHFAGQLYRTIVIDPPWDPSDEGDVDQMGRAQPTYSTMPLADIAALPIAELSESEGCHLYLWITNRSLPKGFGLLEQWGFRYVTALTWCKPSIGIGNYFRNNTEHVLFGVRGSLPLLYQDTGTWFQAPRGGRHSAKPDQFYQMVARLSPAPRLDMFARGPREGFAVWGAEAAA